MINLLKYTYFMESNKDVLKQVEDLRGFTKQHITQYLYIQGRSCTLQFYSIEIDIH